VFDLVGEFEGSKATVL